MSWKPIHAAHAVDRVRILIQFKNPLTDKLLAKATASISKDFQRLGFDNIVRVESMIQNIVLNQISGHGAPQNNQNGWVITRHSSGQLCEEAGFRDGIFGYMTTEYGRWKNLIQRFQDIFHDAMGIALTSVDVQSIKLEYWDRFAFDGAIEAANVVDLLSSHDPFIPVQVIEGQSQWHSHSGWFETTPRGNVLINRNIDVIDEHGSDAVKRSCNIFTLTELRIEETLEDTSMLYDILEELHRRSLQLFGGSLSEQQRQNIGLNLADYS